MVCLFLASGTYKLVGHNTRCDQFAMRHGSALLETMPTLKNYNQSKQQCYQNCLDRVGCTHFIYWVNNRANRINCELCPEGSYDYKATQHYKGELTEVYEVRRLGDSNCNTNTTINS